VTLDTPVTNILWGDHSNGARQLTSLWRQLRCQLFY